MERLLIDIHVPPRRASAPAGRHIDGGLSNWGRPELGLALAERGLGFIYSRGKESYNFDTSQVLALQPDIKKDDGVYSVTVEPVLIAMEGVDAIRNVSSRLGGDLPELNHPKVRDTTGDKLTSNMLFESIGLEKRFAGLMDADELDTAIEQIGTKNLILKPRTGKQSVDIFGGTYHEILRLVKKGGVDLSKGWVLEEQFDFSPELPMKGIDKIEQDKIDFANRNHMPKELRVYTFGRENGILETSFVMRVAKPGDQNLGRDDWVFIDPQSVPSEVIQYTDLVEKALSRQTSVKEMHLAVDWVRVSTVSHKEPQWLPMEVNSGEPQLVYEHENAKLAKEHASKLAEQLHRVAQARSTL